MAIFTEKKAPAASWLAATGLVRFRPKFRRPQNIKFGPKWVENQAFGLKLGPNESYELSGPIRTTPEAQNTPKQFKIVKKRPNVATFLGFHGQFSNLVRCPSLALIDDLPLALIPAEESRCDRSTP